LYYCDSQERLKENVDYEIWLLNFLSETQEMLEGGTNISTITLTNRQPGAHVEVSVTDVIGSGAAIKVMDAMSPLTFTASYKILDMIFEWVLEENAYAGNIQRVPWKFSEKIELISKKYNQLTYPPILQSNSYIRDYSFALFSNLLKFRNEVVHKHNFSVSDNKLRVDTNVDGQFYTLVLDRGELGAFVRTVVAVANLLAGALSFGPWEERLLKYHLDRIQKCHGLAEFKEKKPLLVNVVLNVPMEEKLFPADLKFVRQEIGRIHPAVNVLFNLTIIGLVDEKPSISWYFPINSVPKNDEFELRLDSHEKYRIPLTDGEHQQ